MSTNSPPPDDVIEARLRSALQARADSVPIRGDGLQLIRAVVHRRRTPIWRPILAVAAALVVIVSVGFGVRAITGGSIAVGGSSAAGAKAESAQDAAGGADGGSSSYVGTPLPISTRTPLVWPYANTQAAYSALTSAQTSAQVQLIYGTPQEAAVDFVQSTAPSSSAAAVASDSLATTGSSNTTVAVHDAAGRVVSNVTLGVVLGGGRLTYVVVGATVPGGAGAGLTIDAPAVTGGAVSLGGAFRGSLRASASGLAVVGMTASGGGVQRSSAAATLGAGDSWSAVLTGKLHGVVVYAVDASGTCLGLVATTVQS